MGRNISRLRKLIRKKLRRSSTAQRVASPQGFRIGISYAGDQVSAINQLFEKYGSDKGGFLGESPFPWDTHTYGDVYSLLFDHCREKVENVFECGIGSTNDAFTANMSEAGMPGASLRSWREYFPNARIAGADIDKEVLFSEERIETFFVDQLDKSSIVEMWKKVGPRKFDLIVDDGLHTVRAGITFFENSFARLKDDGIYVIEDVERKALPEFREYFDGKLVRLSVVELEKPGYRHQNNNMLIVRR